MSGFVGADLDSDVGLTLATVGKSSPGMVEKAWTWSQVL